MGLDASHQPNPLPYASVNNLEQSLSADSTPTPSPSGSHQSDVEESNSVENHSAVDTDVDEETTDQANDNLCSIFNREIRRKYRHRRARRAILSVSQGAAAFRQWFSSFQHARGSEAIRCLREAYRRPPISAESLAELEIDSIIADPKLRHDINFDFELHFRPNHDGDSGHRKQQLADDYWYALEAELEIYNFMLEDAAGTVYRGTPLWSAEFKIQRRRLPGVLLAIKNILTLMVPGNDRHCVTEVLDYRLIMQQIEHGTTDLASLATWLAKFLKVHCAPIRDRWIDQMVKHISQGVQECDPSVTVKGLKMIFGILEAMKLDVANHQIRHLRPALLNATTHFEQIYHERRIAIGRVDVAAAHSWFREPIDPSVSLPETDHHLSKFVYNFLWSLLPLEAEQRVTCLLPKTMRPDFDRIHDIRVDIIALVDEEICILRLKAALQRLGRSHEHIEKAIGNFREVLPIIVGESSCLDSIGHIAVEIARIVAAESIPGSWSDRQTSIRNPNVSNTNEHKLCKEIEGWLHRNMHLDSNIFRIILKSKRADLLQRVLGMTKKHVQLTPTQMFDSLVYRLKGPKNCSRRNETTGIFFQQQSGISDLRTSSDSAKPSASDQHAGLLRSRSFDGVCCRITHILALHWNVWAPILYLKEDDEDGDASLEDDTDNEPSVADANAQDEETPEVSDDDHAAPPKEQK